MYPPTHFFSKAAAVALLAGGLIYGSCGGGEEQRAGEKPAPVKDVVSDVVVKPDKPSVDVDPFAVRAREARSHLMHDGHGPPVKVPTVGQPSHPVQRKQGPAIEWWIELGRPAQPEGTGQEEAPQPVAQEPGQEKETPTGRELALQANFNRSSFASDGSDKKEGTQNLLYYSLSYITPSYGIIALGSFVQTDYKYSQTGRKDFTLANMLDTTLSGFYKLPEYGGYNVRLGLDVNIPTGRSSFTSDEINSIFSDNLVADLVTAPSFGKGLDVSPNLSVTKQIGDNNVVGLGFRYDKTGAYDPTKSTPNDIYDPGDAFTSLVSYQHLFSDTDVLFLDLIAVMLTRDRQGGVDVFKQGNVYSLAARYVKGYAGMRATYGLTYSLQEKNQVYGSGGITTEDRNSNSNQYEMFVNLFKPLDSRLSMNGILTYKNRDRNGYDRGHAFYDGGYNKYELGGGVTYIMSDVLYFTANLRLYRLGNKADALEANDASYTGFVTDLGFVYYFSR